MNSREESSTSEKGSAIRVLVMEDEFNVARAIEMVLSEEGYEVVTAMNGQSALEQLHEREFDLLVADLRLPDINGMDVIKRVRREWPQTAVVVITGYPAVGTAVEAMKHGAMDYLPKPFTEEELTDVVSSALKSKGKARLGEVPAGGSTVRVGA